ncbi:MAG: class I SAM-dependent methyltransferase, partial [Acidobacteriaceae bacterium]|nr:class I SAM-dependent methyltransferase [Acidobacteriaceae bacterium]
MSADQPTIGFYFLERFRDEVQRRGLVLAAVDLTSLLWQFLRDSMPDRRRQRYGDIDYDWDHRVDTTGATVNWRDRLLGLLHSPYQPTEPALFHEMMAKLDIDFRQFVFIDIGSGKGRALRMAADYPFRKIIGIELLAQLHRIAQDNIGKYTSDSQRCYPIQTICGDARKFAFSPEPMVLYLFNPLPEPGLVSLLGNLERSLKENPRPVYVLYHNPLLEHLLVDSKWLHKVGGTNQYAVFATSIRSTP